MQMNVVRLLVFAIAATLILAIALPVAASESDDDRYYVTVNGVLFAFPRVWLYPPRGNVSFLPFDWKNAECKNDNSADCPRVADTIILTSKRTDREFFPEFSLMVPQYIFVRAFKRTKGVAFQDDYKDGRTYMRIAYPEYAEQRSNEHGFVVVPFASDSPSGYYIYVRRDYRPEYNHVFKVLGSNAGQGFPGVVRSVFLWAEKLEVTYEYVVNQEADQDLTKMDRNVVEFIKFVIYSD